MGWLDTLARVGTAIVTGGTSELVRLVYPEGAITAQQLLFPTTLKQGIATASAVVLPFGISKATVATAKATGAAWDPISKVFVGSQHGATKPAQQFFTPPQFQTSLVPTGGSNMGIDLGGILSTVSNIFGGNQNPYFQGVSNVTNLASQFVPQPAATPVMARAPQMLAPALRAGAVVGRRFFDKYPHLATAIQALRNMGHNVTRAKLYSLMKRFGPEFLITAGILTAAAVNELMIAGAGRRRMNPGNVSALRRSMRRLESFHKLCVKSDHLRRPRGRRIPCKTGGSQFVRQG